MKTALTVLLFLLLFQTQSWADKPKPAWNGKPFDRMTAKEIKDANKALDEKIKKGDSSAVQQKADLNNAFDKTPEGQRAKKENDLEKTKEDLAILEKKKDAMGDKAVDNDNALSALEKDGTYWDPPHKWPEPPDGKIGPGGDRDRMARKLKKAAEDARKAKETAEKEIAEKKDKIRKLEDELYVKSKDVRDKSKEPPSESSGGNVNAADESRETVPGLEVERVSDVQREGTVQEREIFTEPAAAQRSEGEHPPGTSGGANCPPGNKQ